MELTPAVNMTSILINPKNILIIPYNRMGTILMSSRVFKAIREHYPGAYPAKDKIRKSELL